MAWHGASTGTTRPGSTRWTGLEISGASDSFSSDCSALSLLLRSYHRTAEHFGQYLKHYLRLPYLYQHSCRLRAQTARPINRLTRSSSSFAATGEIAVFASLQGLDSTSTRNDTARLNGYRQLQLYKLRKICFYHQRNDSPSCCRWTIQSRRLVQAETNLKSPFPVYALDGVGTRAGTGEADTAFPSGRSRGDFDAQRTKESVAAVVKQSDNLAGKASRCLHPGQG